MNAAVSRDLPMPASPESRTTLTLARLRPGPGTQHQLGLFLASNEGGQARRVQRLETALLDTFES
jgi:hypothetical protein